MRLEIRRLHLRLGVTTIMVTHDQEEALTMADRIVVMNEGVIEQIGTPLEVYRQPASAFVADFVGTTNFLAAQVEGDGLVRFGGLNLHCEFDSGSQPGQQITLAIRPEDLVVRNVRAGAANTAEVKVTHIEFLGSFCRVSLGLGEQPAALLADFSINVVRDLAISQGQTLLISLPPDRIRVFPGAPQLL